MTHPDLKKRLLPLLNMVAKSFDLLPLSILKYFPIFYKAAIVRRLSKYPPKIKSRSMGIFYEFDLTDLLQREIYFNCYDKKQLPKLLKHIQPGFVCIDIGANIGFYSLHMAKKMEGRGSIFSFEADPFLHKRLVKNCKHNSFGTIVECYHTAISNQNTKTIFYTHNKGASGEGSLTKHDYLQSNGIEVNCVTLDRFLNNNNLNHIDFIKVDVEGNEWEFLEGAKQALSEKKIKKVYMEFNGLLQFKRGKTIKHFLDFFEHYGYFPQDLNQSLLLKLKKREIDQTLVVTDFLFSPN